MTIKYDFGLHYQGLSKVLEFLPQSLVGYYRGQLTQPCIALERLYDQVVKFIYIFNSKPSNILMASDFGNEYVSFGKNEYVSFEFIKIENNLEIMYVCNRGSNWARTHEQMLLTLTQGSWIVYDSARLADNITIHCRQAVFHCDEENITERGWYMWRWNVRADETKTMDITQQNGLAYIFGLKPRCLEAMMHCA